MTLILSVDRIHQQFVELAISSSKHHEFLLKRGSQPDVSELVARGVYKGWNTLLPFMKGPKFFKGFVNDEGYNTGYNIKTEEDFFSKEPIKEDWKAKGDQPQLFGFFDIRPAESEPIHDLYPNALLFDYNSMGVNPRPLSGIMDYVVEVNKSDPRLLLGKFFLTSSFNNPRGRYDTNRGFSTNYFLLINEND